jgi:hypothetical protein
MSIDRYSRIEIQQEGYFAEKEGTSPIDHHAQLIRLYSEYLQLLRTFAEQANELHQRSQAARRLLSGRKTRLDKPGVKDRWTLQFLTVQRSIGQRRNCPLNIRRW